MANLKPLHEQVAEKLIDQLEKGTSLFQQPWVEDKRPAFSIPLNPTTGKNYRGMNALWLSMQPYEDPRWMTLKQANTLKLKIPKDTKATMITFWKNSEERPVLDAAGQEVKDEKGRVKKESVRLEKPVNANAWVFNAEQIPGMPPLKETLQKFRPNYDWTPVEHAEAILTASNASIKFGGNDAFYAPEPDFIQLPEKRQFPTATQFYAVALHELGHWTGHEDRLNRIMTGDFGSPEYAREELRAEIASLMIGSETGIGHYFGQHAAYVENWIKALKEDPYELYRASADAQKISDFVMDMDRNLAQKQEVKTNPVESTFLIRGEEIAYNNTTYRVTDVLKRSQIKIEDLTTGEKMKISNTDGLYKSLLVAKNYPLIDLNIKSDNTKNLKLNEVEVEGSTVKIRR